MTAYISQSNLSDTVLANATDVLIGQKPATDLVFTRGQTVQHNSNDVQQFVKDFSKNRALKPLHIVLVTETWPPEINGVANSVFELAKGLVENGHRITLVRPRQVAAHAASDALFEQIFVTPYKIPNYSSLQFGRPAYLELRKAFHALSPDIVHVVTEGPLGLAALLAARRRGITVSSGYHSQFHDFSDHFGLTALVKPITTYLRIFHNRCDVTCVPSDKSKKELHGYGVKRLSVVGRGVNLASFNPSRRSEDLRCSWGAGKQTTVLMYVGRVSPEKNIPLVIRSFRELTLSQPNRDIKLVVVGDGPDLERLSASAPDVVFVGAKTGEALWSHYASADCFVFASEVETFGNVVTEAMASGLPVVAYNDAAAATYVDANCGWRIRLSDEQAFVDTVAALPSQSELLKMGQAGSARMKDMGWQCAVAQFEQAFADAFKHTKKLHHFLDFG